MHKPIAVMSRRLCACLLNVSEANDEKKILKIASSALTVNKAKGYEIVYLCLSYDSTETVSEPKFHLRPSTQEIRGLGLGRGEIGIRVVVRDVTIAPNFTFSRH